MSGFDVIVIGGGPAGCAVGMLLAREGCKIAIAEKPRRGNFCIGETLPPQAGKILGELGVWEAFRVQGHRASPGIVSVWGCAEPWATDFLFSPHGNGWHIDRFRFNAFLVEEAVRSGAVFLKDLAIANCMECREGWRIGALRCRVVVDATGRRPAGLLGFPRRVVLDRLIAVAGLGESARGGSVSDYTLIEAVDDGWFYSALLPCGEYVAAYMTDADLYAQGCTRSGTFWGDQLAKAPQTKERIERTPSRLGLFSAVTSVREKAARRNWVAVGDAARSHDPLSGLGLSTALNMARDAAGAVMRELSGGGGAEEYDRANCEAFAQYRQAHRMYYGMEVRWPQSKFWKRRRRA